ncbi:MAG: hypothetical protein CL912_13960 [Deltaproteobacteria bacterium]|nr:hypothetical protein [Deltaproteobacteria bacterium]
MPDREPADAFRAQDFAVARHALLDLDEAGERGHGAEEEDVVGGVDKEGRLLVGGEEGTEGKGVRLMEEGGEVGFGGEEEVGAVNGDGVGVGGSSCYCQ